MNKKIAPPLLVLLGLAVYAPALRAGFVGDDRALVLTDPLIRSWRLIWEGFQHFLFTDAGGSDFYRPLQRLSYLLDYAAFIFAPAGYHLVSILWHAAAAVALFFFAEEFLGFCKMEQARRAWVAFLAAVVWLVHPVQSAAVAYVSGRADPLAAAFGFCALFLGLRMLRATRGRKWSLGFGAGLCLLASALSEEMGLLFLALWLLIVIAHRQRAEFWRALGIVVAVLVVYLSLRLPAERLAPPPGRHPAPLLVRPIVIARAVAEYAGLLVLPLHLHVDRDVETHPFGFGDASMKTAAWRELQTLLGIVLIAATAYTLWRARRRPEVFLPLLLAVVSYLPVSGLVALNATVDEYWLYLPSAFLFLGALAALDSLGFFHSWVLRICLTTWLLFLPARTFLRSFDWLDQRTFVTRTIAEGGDSARILINLGELELNDGHLTAAQHALEKALVKEPGNPLALLDLSAVAIKQRDYPRARALLQKITDPPEIEARAQESLVILESRESGQLNLLRLRLAARLGAANWGIEQRYIQALAGRGFPDRAITELKTCLVAAPYRAESWQTMSEVLRRISRPNEAASALAAAEAFDVHLHEHDAPSL
ncbi:MAG: tetratricopeptide repeat protein [Chthoniobacterales bacterium]|nr:tetratricopeptide repeat protein [Chthoniobacterales bacterium]